jgi:hypothetical protein
MIGPAIETRLPVRGGKRFFFFPDGRQVPGSPSPVEKAVPERIVVEKAVQIGTQYMPGCVHGSIENFEIVPGKK